MQQQQLKKKTEKELKKKYCTIIIKCIVILILPSIVQRNRQSPPLLHLYSSSSSSSRTYSTFTVVIQPTGYNGLCCVFFFHIKYRGKMCRNSRRTRNESATIIKIDTIKCLRTSNKKRGERERMMGGGGTVA